jgi:hypothetical protein
VRSYRDAMGSRANYAIIERGVVELFWSRWGGQSVVDDLLAGPAGATAAIRPVAGRNPPPDDDLAAVLRWKGPDRTDSLMDDVFCEGAALIDHDQRVLLAYQWLVGYDAFVDALVGLEAAWPGWQVRWAFDGIGDIAAHLGKDRLSVRGETAPERDEAAFSGPERWTEVEDFEYLTCVLSVRREDGSLELYGSGIGLSEMGQPAAAAFGALPTGFPALDCVKIPRTGIHLDYRSHTAGVWSIDALEGFLDDPQIHWPGWQWQLWGADVREHLARCDGRLVVPQLPEQRPRSLRAY